jgi:LPXTG-motif cell wall-anchored protein
MKRRWAGRAVYPGDRHSLRTGAALSVLAALGLVAANVLSALPASAAPPYPPVGTAPLAVSTTTPAPGETITVSGNGFGPNEVVTLVLHSVPVTLASTLTDSNGTFSVPVTIPSDVRGVHVLTATGRTTGTTFSITLTIGFEPPGGGGGGGLPNTGLMVWGLGIVAVALLTLGAALVVSGRRRRSAAA